MQDLQNTVAATFAKIVASGKVEEMIEKQLNETIGSVIKDALRSYSDFGKSLEEYVKQAVKVDLRQLELPGYNDLILKLIRRQVDAQLDNQLAQQIEKQMSELLAPPPSEIKLSELLKEFIKTKSDDPLCMCGRPERITLHIQRSDSLDGYARVYFDEQENVSEYSCTYQIAMDGTGRCYSVRINEQDAKKTLFVGPFYSFERRIFQLYAAGTKLIVDGESEDDFDTHYPGRD